MDSTIVNDRTLFEKLLKMGLFPVTQNRQLLEDLGFQPHPNPKNAMQRKTWVRTLDHGHAYDLSKKQTVQRATLESPKRKRMAA